jgi:hypothetical protein
MYGVSLLQINEDCDMLQNQDHNKQINGFEYLAHTIFSTN